MVSQVVPVARGVRTMVDRRTKKALSEVSEIRKAKWKAHRLVRAPSTSRLFRAP